MFFVQKRQKCLDDRAVGGGKGREKGKRESRKRLPFQEKRKKKENSRCSLLREEKGEKLPFTLSPERSGKKKEKRIRLEEKQRKQFARNALRRKKEKSDHASLFSAPPGERLQEN